VLLSTISKIVLSLGRNSERNVNKSPLVYNTYLLLLFKYSVGSIFIKLPLPLISLPINNPSGLIAISLNALCFYALCSLNLYLSLLNLATLS
jgi:hypothetical protein